MLPYRTPTQQTARPAARSTRALATIADRLYATDFHNGRVDVFNSSFGLLTLSGGFTDPKIPKGYAPFGIQALGGNVFVTYAKQDAARKDDVAAPGQGYVDEYTPDGQLVARVVNSGKKNAPLNAPWGLALAPAGFSVFAGDLLVGNFGNGRISAYQQRGATWVYKGQLRLANGTPIAVDVLWAIAFGNGAAAGRPGRCTSSPDRQASSTASSARSPRADVSLAGGRRPRPAPAGSNTAVAGATDCASSSSPPALAPAAAVSGRAPRATPRRRPPDRGPRSARVRSTSRRYGSRADASCSCSCSTHFRWCCSAQSSSTQPRVIPFKACRVFG